MNWGGGGTYKRCDWNLDMQAGCPQQAPRRMRQSWGVKEKGQATGRECRVGGGGAPGARSPHNHQVFQQVIREI